MDTYKIRSIQEYDKLVKKKKYLGGFSKKLLEKFIELDGFVRIKEDDSEFFLKRITIIPSKKKEEVSKRIEAVLEKDFRKNVELALDDADHPIEKLRKDILPFFKIFGQDWNAVHEYCIDKFKEFEEWIQGSRQTFDIDTIIDSRTKDKAVIGKKLCYLLGHKAARARVSDPDFSKAVSEILEMAAMKYKKIEFNADKTLSTIYLLNNSKTEFNELKINGLVCSGFGKGLKAKKVILKKCKFDNMLNEAKVGELVVDDCLVINSAFENAEIKKKSIKKLKEFANRKVSLAEFVDGLCSLLESGERKKE